MPNNKLKSLHIMYRQSVQSKYSVENVMEILLEKSNVHSAG